MLSSLLFTMFVSYGIGFWYGKVRGFAEAKGKNT